MSVTIQTYTGRVVDLENFNKEDIDLRDIAVSLSRQRRYAGHSAVPWSVGQHIMLCAAMGDHAGISDNDLKAVFLHDVEETWVQDAIFTIKRNYMKPEYETISHDISLKVFEFFGCEYDEETAYLVNVFDRSAYIIEAMHLLPNFVYDQNIWSNDVNALVTRLINDDFEIPKSLLNMPEEEVAQNIYEVLNVWSAEKTLGATIVVDEKDIQNVGR